MRIRETEDPSSVIDGMTDEEVADAIMTLERGLIPDTEAGRRDLVDRILGERVPGDLEDAERRMVYCALLGMFRDWIDHPRTSA